MHTVKMVKAKGSKFSSFKRNAKKVAVKVKARARVSVEAFLWDFINVHLNLLLSLYSLVSLLITFVLVKDEVDSPNNSAVRIFLNFMRKWSFLDPYVTYLLARPVLICNIIVMIEAMVLAKRKWKPHVLVSIVFWFYVSKTQPIWLCVLEAWAIVYYTYSNQRFKYFNLAVCILPLFVYLLHVHYGDFTPPLPTGFTMGFQPNFQPNLGGSATVAQPNVANPTNPVNFNVPPGVRVNVPNVPVANRVNVQPSVRMNAPQR